MVNLYLFVILKLNSVLRLEIRAFWISELWRCATQGDDQVCKMLGKYLFVQYRWSLTKIAQVSSRCWHYFPVAILVHHRCAPTWHFHTGPCKFLRKISTNIRSLGKCTGLKLKFLLYLSSSTSQFLGLFQWMVLDFF